MLLIWIKSQSACGQAEFPSRKTSATVIWRNGATRAGKPFCARRKEADPPSKLAP
jgi:hypothetical protein